MLGLHATQDAEGWSALALAGNGGMKGASQIVVRKDDATQEWVAEDRYSSDYVTPTLDEQQDVRLLFAHQELGETAWGVLLPLDSCDTQQDYPIQNITVFMHWALGNDHAFSFHGNRRGQFHANLLSAPKEEEDTTGLEYMDFLNPNVTVVAGEGASDETNPYVCTYFDLDVLSEGRGFDSNDKIHFTRFSPVLNKESQPYVHHMILYACSAPDSSGDAFSSYSTETQREHLQVLPVCESMPPGCLEVKFPWAVGGGDTILPPHVGLPMGQGQKWLILQTHYYNRDLHQGIVDSSGVRAYYDLDLREQEAGVMELDGGTVAWQRAPLPHGRSDVALPPLTIPSSCTEQVWQTPLNVIGVSHHMHKLGKKMSMTVQRDGVNLGPMRLEHYYDFNHQSIEEANPELQTLFPGDQITVQCSYDTSSVSKDVNFGELTQDEMCYGIVMYWPRQEEQYLGIVPTYGHEEECTSVATDEWFAYSDASLCAQSLYEDVPEFLKAFFVTFGELPRNFSLPDLCNGYAPFYHAFLLDQFPGLCPSNCGAAVPSGGGGVWGELCTEEMLATHAQDFCVHWCPSSMGVSAYPDTGVDGGGTNHSGAFDYGVWGCPENNRYFHSPAPIPEEEPVACQKEAGKNSSMVSETAIFKTAQLEGKDSSEEDTSMTDVSESVSSGAIVVSSNTAWWLVAGLAGLSMAQPI